MFEFNINLNVYVKLTDLGKQILVRYNNYYQNIQGARPYEDFNDIPFIKTDKDGYTEFQMWNLMEIFGQYIGMGQPNVFDLGIRLNKKDLKEVNK